MDPNAFLMGAAVPSAKFDHVGAEVSGRVVHRETRLQTVFGTNEVKHWPSGDPMYQLVVHIQTTQRSPMIENDNGVRAIYVKGKNFTDAVRDAVKAVGAPGVEVGGSIRVQYVGDDNSSKAPQKPKMYAVQYMAAPPQQAQQQYGQPTTQGFQQYGQPQQPNGWVANQYPNGVPQQPRQQAGPPVYLQHDPRQAMHHEQGPMPDWAAPEPMPAPDPWPAAEPTPAPPPMSTLAAIRAAQAAPASGQPFDHVEPAF
jgi:hypothetical protein